MVQPIDYLGLLPQVDLGQSLLSGVQAGSAFRQAIDQRKAQEAAQLRQEQFSADLQNALANGGDARVWAAMTAKYPDMREAFKQSWELNSQDQKDAEFGAGTQVYSALRQNRPDVAIQTIDENIEALRNSGRDTKSLENIRAQIERDPKTATGYVGLVLSSLEPEKWGKIAGEARAEEAAPFELSEKVSKAQKAAVDARFAESNAAQDLAKKGWDIAKIQNDIGISRQNSQIAALEAGIKRETNDLKRQELQLKLQEKQAKRDGEVRTKVAEVESGRSTIDNFLNTADQVLQFPEDVAESATGTISSILPTLGQDVADFEETLKTLSSQAFLSQVPAMKGLGALTEAEGRKLESSLANLSLRQSPKKLLGNVREAQRLMLKARETLADKYGVPSTTPDTPAATPSPGEIDALLQKYGGQ